MGRYATLCAEKKDLVKKRERDRYQLKKAERQRKVYLRVLAQGGIKKPRAATLLKHGIEWGTPTLVESDTDSGDSQKALL